MQHACTAKPGRRCQGGPQSNGRLDSGHETMDAADPGLSKRFWAKVNKSPDCWLWTASRTGIGVGQFRVGDEMWAAHRVAWSLVSGTPAPRCLRHGCGNLACVRPDHMVTADRRHGPTNLARTWERRFTSFIDKGPECWLWTGSANHVGHGQFDTYVNRKRHVVGAHRVAWELAFGAIPAGLAVLHTCGTNRCVNPSHLALRPCKPETPPTGFGPTSVPAAAPVETAPVPVAAADRMERVQSGETGLELGPA